MTTAVASNDIDIPTTHEADVRPFPTERRKQSATKPLSVKKIILGVLGLSLLTAGLMKGRSWWETGRFMVSTNDAYIHTDTTVVSPQVQGYISDLPIQANQRVQRGDILVKLDGGDFRNALRQSQASVQTQTQTINRIDAQITAAKATVREAEAGVASAKTALTLSRTKLSRTQKLVASSVESKSSLDDATESLSQAEASLEAAHARQAAAKANVGVLKAQKLEAESTLASLSLAVAQAQRNLDKTILRAPVSGTVANISAHIGNLVNPGQSIATIVPVRDAYITANFKETQLAGIHRGSLAKITIDAMPGKTFEGKVASISPATGSQFSLLPPSNATGNFTKIVQRVPVRIELPSDLRLTGQAIAGLSATISIDSRTGKTDRTVNR